MLMWLLLDKYERETLTSLKILTAVWTIPVYLCSPVTWNANRALIVSNGYVKVTAVRPAPAPATNLSACWIIWMFWAIITFPKY